MDQKSSTTSKVVGYFPGAWDLVHCGHVLALEEAKGHCDYLIVGLGAQPEIGNPSKNRPVMSLEERYRILRANKFVDAIIVYETEYESVALDSWLPYDVRFIGADHKGKEHPHIQHGKIIYLSRDHNYSSSELRKRVYEVELARLNKHAKI